MTATGRRRSLCLTLISLGLAVSGYLLARTFALMLDQAPDSFDLCSAIFGTGCDAALLSDTSWVLGIPLAGWGVVYSASLLCLLILAWALGEAFEREATLGAVVLAAAGAVGSLYLTAIVLAGRAPLCPLCMVVHGINLLLVPALARLSERTVGQLLQDLRNGGKYVRGGRTDAPREARWKTVGFVTTALVAVVLYQWVLVESERRVHAADGAFDPAQALAAYASTPRQDIPLDPDDPRIGSSDAPVRLVVFSSFQCPGCRAFAQEMRHLADRYVDELTITFKHFPLETACNAAASFDKHPRSCEAAWAAEAAHRQGGFWPFHDALFATSLDASDETINRIALKTGLDLAQFEVDRRSEATLAKVRADCELGNRLGVDATPSLYLNGRRIRRASRRTLELLIDQELKAAEP